MFGKKLVDLGKQIGTVAKNLKLCDIELDAVSRMIDDRKLVLSPEGGWVGKNEAERGIAASKAFAADEELNKMVDTRIAETKKRMVLEGDLALLEAERRGMEFAVRDALANALGGYDETGPEFDTVADKEVDGRYFKKTQDGSYEALPPVPENAPVVKTEYKVEKYNSASTSPVKTGAEVAEQQTANLEKAPIVVDQEEKALLDSFGGPTPGVIAAPKVDVETPKTPPAKPEVKPDDPDVDKMLKEMGF